MRANQKTQKVLHVFGGLGMGGAETMIMNVFRVLGQSNVCFDFVVSGEQIGYYEPEAAALGGSIHHITKRSVSMWKHHRDFYDVIRKNGYEIIHFHTQNAFLTVLEICAAKMAGVKRIIVHCHNTMDWRKGKMLTLHEKSRGWLNRLADVRLSCGNDASKWLYGSTEGVQILPLPVMCDRYRYSQKDYDALREQMGLTGKKVYIHVGRFSDVKNHTFLLDVFAQLVKREPDSVLLMAGDGELRPEMEAKAKALCLEGKAVFLGNINDVYNKLILADAFLFPSKYEGFPTVVLEAQAAGLPCIISDTITPEIALTELVTQLPLDASAEHWADEILRICTSGTRDRLRGNEVIRETYDVSVTRKQLLEIYLQERS